MQMNKNIFLFVTYIIIQSITSSEMCSLHLTHPSTHTHTLGAVEADAAAPGSSRGFGALLKGLTSVVDNSCQSRDSNPQPRVTSPTLYPLSHDRPLCCLRHRVMGVVGSDAQDLFKKNVSKEVCFLDVRER